ARHLGHHSVGLRDRERIVRAIVLVQVSPGRATGVGIDLLQPLLHRDPVSHHLPRTADERGELVADDALVSRIASVFGGLDCKSGPQGVNRKSTRLNSSHEWISYA